MEFKSVNPFNGEEVGSYTGLTSDELESKLEQTNEAFGDWRKVSIEDRAALMENGGNISVLMQQPCT